MNTDKTGMIFIVGNSRSGTTMLGRMLGRNHEVFNFPELHLFGPCIPHGKEEEKLSKEEILHAFCWLMDVSRNGFHGKRNLQAYTEESLLLIRSLSVVNFTGWDVYRTYVLYEAKRNNKTIPCEDLPGNIFKLKQITQHFKDARIIHIVRDPRDVVLSQKNRHQRRKMGGHYVSKKEALRVWSNYHPFVIARLWNNAVSSALAISGEEILTVHFEKLLSHPEEVLKKICNHIGLEYKPEMLRIPQVGSSSQKDDPSKFGVDSGRSGAWQRSGLNNAEIAICEKVNGKIMKIYGYPLSGKKLQPIAAIAYLLLLPIKGILALLLNWSRTKGIWNYLQQRFFK